jgi:hypothetical protein
VVLTGIGTGIAAAALTRLLELVQRLMWGGNGTDILDAAQHAGAWRHIFVLLGAGVVTGAGQILLKHLSSGNGIDTTAAIWFHAGRMPPWRTLGSAVLSVIIVGISSQNILEKLRVRIELLERPSKEPYAFQGPRHSRPWQFRISNDGIPSLRRQARITPGE